MNMNDYLEKVDKYLKAMPASERIDIVKEIKSAMDELEAEGLASEQIAERLGNPKELAQAYLGTSISNSTAFSWKKFRSVVSFYGLVGLKGMFVLPFISVLSVCLMISGILSFIGGIIKFTGYLLGYEVPFVIFQIGTFTANPILSLPISVILGCLLILLGKKLWRFTIKFIENINVKKEK